MGKASRSSRPSAAHFVIRMGRGRRGADFSSRGGGVHQSNRRAPEHVPRDGDDGDDLRVMMMMIRAHSTAAAAPMPAETACLKREGRRERGRGAGSREIAQ